MRAITKNVYIEDQFVGVILGVVNLRQGLVQIDAPPSPEDGRSWRATLLNLDSGADRILVNLDAHPDRTLGARAMDCTVIAHEKVSQIFRSRSNTFKAQGDETGADWETISGIGNIRWAPPEVTFNQQMFIHWDDESVVLEYHPGPSAGAAWLMLPDQKLVFVGDAVLKNQPPFLESADLPSWLETLKLLLSPAYRGWTVISGRSGPVAIDVIRAQREILEQLQKKMEKLAAKKIGPDGIESLVAHMQSAFKVPASRQRQYNHRLHHGLLQYYQRHFHANGSPREE